MLTVTTRGFSEEEKRQLAARLPTRYQQLESFAINFIFSVFLLLLPFLLLTKHLPVSEAVRAGYCALAVLGGLSITWYVERPLSGGRTRALQAIATGRAEVLHVCASRAVRREDPEDFGVAFYFDVSSEGQPQLLYLQGQDFDLLVHDGIFPNTEFELIRDAASKGALHINLLGQSFGPERTLPAFSMEQWRAGHTPTNGDVLPGRLEDLA